jgi:hypothetical protein
MPQLTDLLSEYLDRLEAIEGIVPPTLEKMTHTFCGLDLLLDNEALKKFKSVHEWFIPALKQKLAETPAKGS